MQLVFKVTDPSPSVPPQVGETNFQDHYTGVNYSMAFDELRPGIRQATEKYVIDFIGLDLYNDLAAKFIANSLLSAEQSTALALLQDCIAYYTIYHVLPEKRSVLASMGVVEPDPSGGANPAAYPIYLEKRRGALENGDTFLDRLLNFLEIQVRNSVVYFDLWKNSDAYNIKSSDFFRHTIELDSFLNIKNSRRSFVSIIRFVKQVEDDTILPTLCAALYAKTLVPNPAATEMALLPYIRKTAAYLGAAEAIPHHRIVIDGDGFRVVSYTDGSEDRRNMTNSTHEKAIQALKSRCEDKGRKALSQLIVFLEENIGDYPDYENSTCREKPKSTEHSIRQSSNRIGAVGIM